MPLSIEIRSKKLQVIQTAVSKNRVFIKKSFSVDLQEGWIDAKGVTDIAAVTFALSTALANHGIKEKKVSLCINNHSVIYRELLIPKVEDKRIPFVVRSEMIATLDLNKDHIIDFIILDEVKEAHKTQLRVLGVAISQKALSSYVETCVKLNLKVDNAEPATTAMIKLVEKSKVCDDGRPVIIADVEDEILKLYLFENNKYVFIRNTKLVVGENGNHSDLISNVEDDINKMMQYQFTLESHIGVQKVIFFGTHHLISEIEKSVNSNLSVETSLYPKPEFLNVREESHLPYLYPIAAALRR